MRYLALVAVVLQLTGCAALTPPSSDIKLEKGTGYWFSYDATRRGTVLVPGSQDSFYSCSEPAPDVMLGLISTLEARLKDPTIEVNAKGQLATSALQLATRTQMVMFLRESLYRLCELNLNTHLSQQDISSLYAGVIAVAKDVALAEVNQAVKVAEEEKRKAAEAQTIAEKEKAKASEAQKIAEEEKRKAAEAQAIAEQEKAKTAEVVKQAEQEKLRATQAQQKLEDTKAVAPK